MNGRRKPQTLDEALEVRGSMSALARTLGVTVGYLHDIRKGKKTPSLELALRIARETRVPLESLIRRAA